MAGILEEKLREAACLGDVESVRALLSRNIDVNARNQVNGWTALHWACKRGNEQIVRLLLNNGADRTVENVQGQTAGDVCTYRNINELLGSAGAEPASAALKFVPNYLKNAPLNGKVDLEAIGTKHPDLLSMPNAVLPVMQNEDLVLKVKIHASPDPDFIEVELPRWKLTYDSLLKTCCEELGVAESLVERVRKLPDTRLRTDNDVKRLTDYQALELVLRGGESGNPYQSIGTCKDQTILY
ncbi:ankyrin repeat domain-containing protein 40-like [Cylas formicarius]|uniref:ankyrin repeat domain-containing protein 40-like n=1 Tax=Cylas formicarius TaxID=197179 RepID=UPI00295888E0|nr:ankyrin repeat domain-containing protein 40-like [Cylas formicarius]